MQKETKHTAGPWRLPKRRNSGGNYMIKGSGGTDVACITHPDWGYDAPKQEAEALANARLIAAAPELLEALEGILELAEIGMRQIQYEVSEKVQGTMYNKNDVLNAEEAYSTAEKAIAKARGGHE